MVTHPGPVHPQPRAAGSEPTRRHVLTAGAALSATAWSTWVLDGGSGPASAGERPGGTIAAVASATESLTLGFPSFWPMKTGTGAGIVYGGNGTAYATDNGYVAAPIALPAGAQILGLDVHGDTTGGSATQPWYFQAVTTTGTFTLLATITATGGPGPVSGTYTGAPITVADTTTLYLEVQATSATNRVRSAVIRYLPAAAGLRLNTAPVRVYDSRPNNPPAIGPKTPLGGGTSRPIDGTADNAVPAGARAVLANVTLVTRSSAGFVSLFRHGLAWPGTSSINWTAAGAVVGGTQIIALDTSGSFDAYCAPGASTDILVDVVGYLV